MGNILYKLLSEKKKLNCRIWKVENMIKTVKKNRIHSETQRIQSMINCHVRK